MSSSDALALQTVLPTGALAATFDRRRGGVNAGGFTSQTVYLYGIYLPDGITVTSISVLSGTTALSVGVHQYFGLYDASRNRLAVSADDTSTAWASNTVKSLGMTAAYPVTVAGVYYIGILVQATTMPSFVIASGTTSAITTVAPIVGGASSAAQTSLPASAGAITPNTFGCIYAYVS